MDGTLVTLLDQKLADLGRAHPLAQIGLARDAVNLAASIIRDHEWRLSRAERHIADLDATVADLTRHQAAARKVG